MRFSKDADFLDKSFEEPLRYRKWKGAEEKPAEEGELSFREGAAVVKLRAGESITIGTYGTFPHTMVFGTIPRRMLKFASHTMGFSPE